MSPYLYFALLIFEAMMLIGISIYLFFLIYSSLKGSPYVPSKTKQLLTLLAVIKPTKKTSILELGCGDGRLLRLAAMKYQASGLGIDINPVVLLKAKIAASLQKLQRIEFRNVNINQQSLDGFQLIYLFLMPKLLAQLAPRLKKELKPSTLVVSHGFKIPTCDRYITRTLLGKPFDFYFYRFPKRKAR